MDRVWKLNGICKPEGGEKYKVVLKSPTLHII